MNGVFYGISNHCWKGSSSLLSPPPFPPWAYFRVTFWRRGTAISGLQRSVLFWQLGTPSVLAFCSSGGGEAVRLWERELCLGRSPKLARQRPKGSLWSNPRREDFLYPRGPRHPKYYYSASLLASLLLHRSPPIHCPPAGIPPEVEQNRVAASSTKARTF